MRIYFSSFSLPYEIVLKNYWFYSFCFLINYDLDLCTDVPCKNGGTCSMKSDSTYTCLCPSLYSGNRCETRKRAYKIILGSIRWSWWNTYRITSVDAPSHNTESWNTVPVYHVHPSFPPSWFPLYEQNKQHLKKTPSIAKVEPIRRNFPRTWIWEEIHMRFELLSK